MSRWNAASSRRRPGRVRLTDAPVLAASSPTLWPLAHLVFIAASVALNFTAIAAIERSIRVARRQRCTARLTIAPRVRPAVGRRIATNKRDVRRSRPVRSPSRLSPLRRQDGTRVRPSDHEGLRLRGVPPVHHGAGTLLGYGDRPWPGHAERLLASRGHIRTPPRISARANGCPAYHAALCGYAEEALLVVLTRWLVTRAGVSGPLSANTH